jgi:hypothetical protein
MQAPEPKQIHLPVTVSYKYCDPGGKFCLSECDREDIKRFKELLKKITTTGWSTVLASGGKGKNKTGMAYTPYSDDDLKGVNRPAALDPGVRIFGVRASQKSRLFAAYLGHVIYVLWYDPDHKIVPA